MKAVTLGNLADIQSGVAFPLDLQGRRAGDYPFAKVGDISRGGRAGEAVLSGADHYVNDADLPRLRAKPVTRGSILFAKIGEAIRQNHRVIAGCDMLIDNNAMAVTPGKEVTPEYLYHFLRTVDFYRLASATTVPSIRKSDLARIRVPLPSLREQRRIAEVLDRAEALLAKRRATLAMLDAAIESVFHDLFGDPATNSRCWETPQVGAVADVQGGLQLSSTRKNYPVEVPYLRVANVFRGRLDLRELKTLRAKETEVTRTTLQRHDLLVVEGHGNPTEIGRCAMWDGSIRPCVHQNHLIRIRFDQKQVLPTYAVHFLNTPGGRRHLLRAGKTTSGLNTISVSDVRSTPISVPPIELQRRFAGRVDRVDQLRATFRLSFDGLERLFRSLQHHAFRGEL